MASWKKILTNTSNSVVSDNITSSAVTTAKINNEAVTQAKMANDSVRLEQLDTSNTGSVGQVLSLSPTTEGLTWITKPTTVSNDDWSGTDLSVANGGTGASSASGARTNLGLGSLATASTISNSNWSGTDLAIANGGTGASTASAAVINLGLGAQDDVEFGTLETGSDLTVNGQSYFYDTVNFSQSDIDVSNSSIIGLSTIYVLSYNLQMPVLQNRYYMPNASYGASYHSWDRYMTSIPTNLYFSSTYNMPIVIPKAGKILKWGFNGAGNSSLIQSCTWYLRYGTMANGATATGTLATVGTDKTVTVSSSSRQYEWKNSGLSHTVAEDGILFPFAKGSCSSTKYLRGTFYVVIEYTPT